MGTFSVSAQTKLKDWLQIRRAEVESMKTICSHYFPWQLIIVMPNWLLIGTALLESGARTPAWHPRAEWVQVSGVPQEHRTAWPRARPRPEASHRPACGVVQRLRLGHGSQRASHAQRTPSQSPAPPGFGGATHMKILARAFSTLTTSQAYAGQSSLGEK